MPKRDSEQAAGADAVVELLVDILAATERQFADYDELPFEAYGDVRDYREFAELFEAALTRNYVEATSARREGFLRAMASLLSQVADGFSPDLDEWRPLDETRGAYEVRGAYNVLLRHVSVRHVSADVRKVGKTQ